MPDQNQSTLRNTTNSSSVMVAGFPLKVSMGENENQEANLNISLKLITEHEAVIGVADVSHG